MYAQFTTFAALAPENRAAALALRDACLSARDLARDFDGAQAVEAARGAYWLALVAAGLAWVEAQAAARFAPISRAEIFDALCAAVDYARSVAPAGAWHRAIDSAWAYILDAEILYFNTAARALRVESATRPGRCYVANGDCQCEAFTKGAGVCWHRAAARIVTRALELHGRARDLAEGQGVSYARALPAASAALGFPIYAARPLAA